MCGKQLALPATTPWACAPCGTAMMTTGENGPVRKSVSPPKAKQEHGKGALVPIVCTEKALTAETGRTGTDKARPLQDMGHRKRHPNASTEKVCWRPGWPQPSAKVQYEHRKSVLIPIC